MSLAEILDVKERKEEYARIFFSPDKLKENLIMFKLISNLVRKTGGSLSEIDEISLLDASVFEHAQQELIDSLASVASIATVEAEPILQYSTGQIARFFGVSQTTISNWIAQDRFEGVVRPDIGKHVEIPSDTIFKYPSGRLVCVKEVVDKYEAKEKRLAANTETESDFIERKIKGYEEKYGAIELLREQLEKGVRNAGDGGLDLDVWEYLMQRRDALGG